MKYIYRIYQLFIALPIILFASLLTSIVTIIGCFLGNGHFWGYYPGKLWAQLIVRILLLPVRVEGRENLIPGCSYVFVSNHQGAFDIFLIYGFLNRNFKWMMKWQLRKIPQGERDIRQGARSVARGNVIGSISRRLPHVFGTYVPLPPRCVHACRRAATARLPAHYQRFVQRNATHTRHEMGVMASADAYHSQTDTAKGQRRGI